MLLYQSTHLIRHAKVTRYYFDLFFFLWASTTAKFPLLIILGQVLSSGCYSHFKLSLIFVFFFIREQPSFTGNKDLVLREKHNNAHGLASSTLGFEWLAAASVVADWWRRRVGAWRHLYTSESSNSRLILEAMNLERVLRFIV